MTSDVNGTVVAIQGNVVKSITLGTNQDGYVMTWINADGYIEFLPPQNKIVSTLKTSDYTVVNTDYLICIGTLSTLLTVTLPSLPNLGVTFIIKDVNGTCGLPFRIKISGGSNNIDSFGTSMYMARPHQSLTLIWTGSKWSII